MADPHSGRSVGRRRMLGLALGAGAGSALAAGTASAEIGRAHV